MERSDSRTCVDTINQLLLNSDRGNDALNIFGFMVHDSIFKQFCANLSQHRLTIDENRIWDYKLNVENECFMMKLIYIEANDDVQRGYLSTRVEYAKISFYWEDAITLYTKPEYNNNLKSFIAEKNLTNSIKRSYTTNSISYDRTELEVIEFDETVTEDIIKEFHEKQKEFHEKQKSQQNLLYSYYVTHALEYLAPNNLKHFDVPYTNPDTLLIIYLVLDYHRSRKLKKIREVFNIFDLCSMKLAFDDPRYEYENCEFDKLIKSSLKTKKYIKSGTFNLKLYTVNKAVYKLPNSSIVSYLVSNYHANFNRIEYFEKFTGWGKQQNFLKLTDIEDPMNLIAFLDHNKMAEIYYIDGTNFKMWSSAFFIKLCERRARRIIIDSSSTVWENYDQVELNINRDEYVKSLEIIGTNDMNFIENFFNWLKFNLGDMTKYFNVTFDGCPINHPFIFNRLTIGKIVLKNLTITKHLLDSIARCEYLDVMTNGCKLENNVAVIGSLDQIKRVHMMLTLQEEGHTLELFMRFVEQYMKAHDLYEFEFKNKIYLITNAFLNFDEYKFVMNDNRTRLDFYHKDTGTVIDIYEYRFRKHIGVDEVFDFYN